MQSIMISHTSVTSDFKNNDKAINSSFICIDVLLSQYYIKYNYTIIVSLLSIKKDNLFFCYVYPNSVVTCYLLFLFVSLHVIYFLILYLGNYMMRQYYKNIAHY